MNYWSIAILSASVAASSFITHKVDEGNNARILADQQKMFLDNEKKVADSQSKISQQKQGERDAIQSRYDAIVSQYNGVRKQLSSTMQHEHTAIAIPKEGFRLYGSDASILTTFARDCEITELERNEVIEKYDALTIS